MADYILDKGYPVLSTYNASAAGGVTAFRAVKFSVSGSVAFIDLNVAATTMSIGVVQENIDQAKVATGKAVADVRILGVTKMVVQTGTSIVIGSRLTLGNAGGAIIAASGNQQVGICVGMSVPGGTVGNGDIVDVLLTPGAVAP
jgi:hypothetical protein